MGLTEASAFKDGKIVKDDVNASASIQGTKISPDFGSQNKVTTGTLGSGNITVTSNNPQVEFVDSSANPDYYIRNDNGVLKFHDSTNSANRLLINTDGHVDVTGNLDVNGQFKLFDDDNSHSIGLKAPATIASNLHGQAL